MTFSVPSFLAAATRASMPPNAVALVAVLLFFASPVASLAGGAQAARPTTTQARPQTAAPRREPVRTGASSNLTPSGSPDDLRRRLPPPTKISHDRRRRTGSRRGPAAGRSVRLCWVVSAGSSRRCGCRRGSPRGGGGWVGAGRGPGAGAGRRGGLAVPRAARGDRLGDGLRRRSADLRAGLRPGG